MWHIKDLCDGGGGGVCAVLCAVGDPVASSHLEVGQPWLQVSDALANCEPV